MNLAPVNLEAEQNALPQPTHKAWNILEVATEWKILGIKPRPCI
jgi:hypothetical protein